MRYFLVFILALFISNAQAQTGDVSNPPGQGAWTTYTPTATCGAGTITTDTVAGRFKIIGKTIFVQINLSISTLGTCTGNVTFNFPTGGTVNATGSEYVGSAINTTTGASVPVFALTGVGIAMFFAAAPTAVQYFVTITYETT